MANSAFTQSSISVPVGVANGGTGATTLGDAGVLIGNGTGALQVTSAGTAGQVLTSNGAGVDPTFQAATTPAITIFPTSVIRQGASAPAVRFNVTTNTTAYLGMVVVDAPITVNKVTIRSHDTVAVAGTLDISLYSQDGQTRYFSVTTASISAVDTLVSTSVSSVNISAGVYYIMINSNGTANVDTFAFTISGAVPYSATAGLLEDVTGEPIVQGTLTITAGTPPTTFDPTAITSVVGAGAATLLCRLDN